MDYPESPKIMLTTNFVLDSEGETNKRRLKEVELAPYYKSSLTPQDEFGELFFIDWDEGNWSMFDTLMIHCVQRYLKRDFVDVESTNKNKKLFFQKYGEETLDWIERQPAGEELRKQKLYVSYKEEMFDVVSGRMTNMKFYAAMKLAPKASDIIKEVEEGKDKKSTYYKITRK